MTTVQIRRQGVKPTVIILSAGIGSKTKSSEPRSLVKYMGKTIVEHQIKTINNSFNGCDIIVVCGYESHKVAKKVFPYENVRIIENENYEKTGPSSSLRLALNNTKNENVLVFHGDLIFNTETLSKLDYSRSFIVIDEHEMFDKKEAGVIIKENDCASIISYGLDDATKWAQIVFFNGEELERLNKNINKVDYGKNRLLFEIINELIDVGGNFKCQSPKNMEIFELDSMKEFYDKKVNIK